PVVARGICDMHRARRRLGIPDDQPVARRPTRAEIEAVTPRMIEMRRAGARIHEIAEEVGVGPVTVGRILRREGIVAPERIPHGTPSAWQYHGCTCEVCGEAKREYRRVEHLRKIARERITAPHGTPLAYSQGCRCRACTDAAATESAERQARTIPAASRSGQPWEQWEAEIAMDRSLTIEQRAARIGRTFAAVDDWIRAYRRRPDGPFRVKGADG